MKKRKSTQLASFLLLCTFEASILILYGCNVGKPPKPIVSENSTSTNEIKIIDPSKLDSAILQRCKNATVLIGNFEGGKIHSSGSGFVVDDGKTIITNKHVVTGSDDTPDPLKIVFLSGTGNAKLIQVPASSITTFGQALRKKPGYDELDVASIRISEKYVAPLLLGKTEEHQETTAVWAFGFPQGISIRNSGKDLPNVTVHSMRIERIQMKANKAKVLQISGSATNGNSGGPVVLSDGSVIGILQARAEQGTPILYAVTTTAIRDMVERAGSTTNVATEFTKPIGEPAQRPKVPSSPQVEPRPKLVGRSIISQYVVTEEVLDNLTPRTLTILRNEPFARRGYIFKRADLNAIFSKEDWYVPRTRNLAAVQASLTKLESRNVDYIKAYQTRTGQNW